MERLRAERAGAVAYVRRLEQNFGRSFLVLLVSAYMGVKGALYYVVVLSQLPFYREMGVGAAQYQIYGSIANTPWAMKGLIGGVSDALPLCGYHKRGYIGGACVVGVVSFALLAAVSFGPDDAKVCAALFFLATAELAVVDLLCEGKYAEMMVKHPETGADLVTWVWLSYHVGTLIGSALTGPMADYVSPRAIFWVALPLAAQILVPTLSGALQEEQIPKGKRGLDWKKLAARPRLFGLAAAMGLASLGLAATNMFGSRNAQSLYALVASTGLCALSFVCLPRQLAKANFYMFLTQALYFSTSGASDYWMTADEDCVPGGPHFSYTYYSTFTSVVGSIFSIIGVALFQRVLSDWDFRPVFWVTTMIRVFASLVDIVMVKRWNVTVLGISDHMFYLLGDAIVYQIVYTLDFMPGVVLTSKLCPKHVEATIYAILAGYQNFGQQVARTGGVYLMEALEVVPERLDGGGCEFDGMPMLLLLSHALLPLLAVPMTFVLIPDSNMRAELPPDQNLVNNESENREETNAFAKSDELAAAERRGLLR